MDSAFGRFCVDPKNITLGLHVRQGDLCRLLHHVAELAGKSQSWFAVHDGRLDEENIPTGTGYRKTGGYTWDVGPIGRLVLPYLWFTEVILHVFFCDRDRVLGLVGGDFGSNLAGQLPEFSFEVSHPGLAGVTINDCGESVFAEFYLLRLQSGTAHLTGEQMVSGDFDLFVVGISVDTDHLGAIK